MKLKPHTHFSTGEPCNCTWAKHAVPDWEDHHVSAVPSSTPCPFPHCREQGGTMEGQHVPDCPVLAARAKTQGLGLSIFQPEVTGDSVPDTMPTHWTSAWEKPDAYLWPEYYMVNEEPHSEGSDHPRTEYYRQQ